ncbi:MAG: phosphodiester glycosidase family protein [Deltaproteobacteria bacterium]|nr:phosphodiester glycosidase family protein [Deltaproteobacteria bacterium]
MGEKRIKWIPLLFALATFPMVVGQAGSYAADTFWQRIDEGFEARSMQLDEQPYQTSFKLWILRIDPEKFRVRMIDSRDFGADRMEIRDLAKKKQALAAVNGGFFLPDYKPLGLLIVDGREASPLRKADWGIFLIQDNRPRIIHTKEFQNEGTISQALQVGPRLVVNGRAFRMKKQLARRSALGVTFKNQVILLNTEDTDAYLQDLARIFRLPESEGGLECRDALTLDGGPSAQMYAEFKSLRIDIRGGWAVPNGVGVFKKQP